VPALAPLGVSPSSSLPLPVGAAMLL